MMRRPAPEHVLQAQPTANLNIPGGAGVGVSTASDNAALATMDREAAALRTGFRLSIAFGLYLLVLQLLVIWFAAPSLVHALLRLVPFLIFLVAMYFGVRGLIKWDRTTMSMVGFLFCVLLFFVTNLTKSIPLLDGVPVFGAGDTGRREVQDLAEVVAVVCFFASAGFALSESHSRRRRLKLEKAQLLRVEAALRRGAAFDVLVQRILSRFATSSAAAIPAAIRESLRETGEFTGADVAMLVLAAPDMRSWSLAHEWCAPGITSRKLDFQDVPMGTLAWAEQKILAGEVIRFNRLEDLPPGAEAIRPVMEAQGVRSRLMVPLRGRAGRIRGCFGLDAMRREVQWSEDDLRRLEVLGEAAAGVIERQRTEDVLIESERKIHAVFDLCFEFIGLLTPSGTVLESNRSALEFLGLELSEVLGRPFWETPWWAGSKELQEKLRHAIARAAGGELVRFEVTHMAKTGLVHTVDFSLKPVKDDAGRVVLLIPEGRDITERKQAEEELKASREQLRALSSRVETLREEERAHIAREIHDHLGQLLTALKLELRSLERKVGLVEDAALRAGLLAKIESSRELADAILTSVRQIAAELRPVSLDQLGLASAIEAECAAAQARTGMTCECDLAGALPGLAPEKVTALFRIFQEILTNAIRHSCATRLTVRLHHQRDVGVVLDVADNGVGMDGSVAQRRTSLGLAGMTERAVMHGGGILFGGGPGQGTRVVLTLPVTGVDETATATGKR